MQYGCSRKEAVGMKHASDVEKIQKEWMMYFNTKADFMFKIRNHVPL